MSNIVKKIRAVLAAPPEPFLETRRTKNRLVQLIDSMPATSVILNIGAGYTDYGPKVVNVDIFDSGSTDIIASALRLPFTEDLADLVILQGVLEHVKSADETLGECIRVMKKGGLFYTEMPFLQPYHESPIDLRRSTMPGLPELCLPLRTVESGIHMGPASTITWIIRELFAGILSGGDPKLYPRVNSLVGWVVFPLKYADYWLEKKTYLHRIASSLYYIGKK